LSHSRDQAASRRARIVHLWRQNQRGDAMTAPAPDPHPNPEPFPHPEPGPATPDETPVRIIDLPPNQPSPGIPVDNPLPS